jgi:threonine dehydrogenase-like Zn-dependent dehydrogenase
VEKIRRGQVVIMPFAFSDGTCTYCEHDLQTSCVHGGFFGSPDVGGAQAEALRIPQADGTLYPVDVNADDALMPALLTLSDVMGTGHHAALCAKVRQGGTAVVIGDGAVGLCAVIAAKRMGAERIILMGRHKERTELGRQFGATDVVAERGEDAVAKVRELTQGHGAHSVLECVGNASAIEMALGCVRAGGAIGRVGVPHYGPIDLSSRIFYDNVTIAGGPAPVRAYIEELLPDVLDGSIEPGRVFDRTIGLELVPEGYRAMNDREALKVLIRP